MTTKRFEINKDMNLDSKIETYELSCIVDNDNKTFYFVVDSIANVESFVERLNELHEENDGLKKQITLLKVELNIHEHPLWSTREAERKVSELTDLLSNETKKNAILLEEINSLRKKNMRLKEVQKYE